VRRQALHVVFACTVPVGAMLAGAVHAADKHVAQWPKVSAAPAPLPVEPDYVPQWPVVAAEPTPWWHSAFKFEAGARYWFSTSEGNFDFSNKDPRFGNPSSALHWKGTTGNAGELFARFDHKPSGLFVKGMIGGGGIATHGEMMDRHFLVDERKYLDTTSDVKQSSFSYASGDIGLSYSIPEAGMQFGAFFGYQYWREKTTAYGARCQADEVGAAFCPVDAVLAPFTVPVLIHEPTWHAVRLGAEGKIKLTPRLSLSGEIAAVPYAGLINNDSHLLRQIPTDLGPVPNVIAKSNRGYGVQAELFVNYALTSNWEVGAGLRYWGLRAAGGSVDTGPKFDTDHQLTNFEQQRYGVLVQIKGRL
jgi:hypothetical protein